MGDRRRGDWGVTFGSDICRSLAYLLPSQGLPALTNQFTIGGRVRCNCPASSVESPELTAESDLRLSRCGSAALISDLRGSPVGFNFEVGKVVAIVLVVIGHFLPGKDLWIPVTCGLFLFGFGSGFFTSARYRAAFDWRRFWRNKATRLLPHLVVINVFLFLLFLTKGTEGIWTWQTPIHLFGLTGLLNWFGVPNESPFGAGLWFFTLLLIFYAVYPLLRLTFQSTRLAAIVTTAGAMAALVLTRLLPMGHALWLTAWSFLLGMTAERLNLSARPAVAALVGALFAGALVVLNTAVNTRVINAPLIMGVAASACFWLKSITLPRAMFAPLSALSKAVFAIYFIHTYLFVHPTRSAVVNLLVSLALICCIAIVLSNIGHKGCEAVLSHRTRPKGVL